MGGDHFITSISTCISQITEKWVQVGSWPFHITDDLSKCEAVKAFVLNYLAHSKCSSFSEHEWKFILDCRCGCKCRRGGLSNGMQFTLQPMYSLCQLLILLLQPLNFGGQQLIQWTFMTQLQEQPSFYDRILILLANSQVNGTGCTTSPGLHVNMAWGGRLNHPWWSSWLCR